MDEYLWTIFGIFVSFVCGILAYACRFADRNWLFGVRTPYSMQNDANWREVNDRCSRMVPPISAAAAVVASGGFLTAAMRREWVFLAVVALNLGPLVIAAFWPPRQD